MTKNILITGGAGFIGSNFVHHLFDRFPEYRIKVLDALTYAGDVANLPVGGLQGGRMEFVYGDVRNGELVTSTSYAVCSATNRQPKISLIQFLNHFFTMHLP